MSTTPGLITYAQNREDLYLWALVGHRTPGVYVDVGCNHERVHSVTRMFYEQGWAGVNIDANRRMAGEYKKRSRDRFVLAAVGAEEGELTFRSYPLHDGLSTMDEAVKELHESSGYPARDAVVRVRPLSSILDEFDVASIDFLKVDVEGFEADVLRGLDFGRVRPAVVVVEASRLHDCAEILLPLSYRQEFFDGLNAYFVDDDATDITIHNYAGRVLQVGFRTDREVQLEAALVRSRSSTIRDSAPYRTVIGGVHRCRMYVQPWRRLAQYRLDELLGRYGRQR